MAKKQAEWEEQEKKAKGKGGKAAPLSGRALFHVNAALFKDDDAALDDREYEVVSDDDEEDGNQDANPAGNIGTDQVDGSLFLQEGDDDDLDDLDDLDDD